LRRDFNQLIVRPGVSWIGGKQADDLIGQIRLRRGPIVSRERGECTGDHVRDVPGQSGMRLGGVELVCDDASGVGVETKKPRLQAGRDKALVEAERKVILVVGHLERELGYSRASRPDNARRARTQRCPRSGWS
jgi:hypothetical protein